MTLRARLLIATCILSVAITVGLSLLVRRAWEQTERQRFDESFRRAISEVQTEVEAESAELEGRLAPLCAHDTAVDSALLGLLSQTLPERLLKVSLSLEEQRKALGFDELALVAKQGLLAGTLRGQGAVVDLDVVERIREDSQGSFVRKEPELALEAHCKKEEGDVWVAVVAEKQLAPVIEAAARHHDLTLSLVESGSPPPPALPGQWTETIVLSEVGGLVLVAHRSRVGLTRSLAAVDWILLSATLAILLLAFGVAILLARGLSRPVIEFAQRTRQAISGHAEPLPVEGGPELEQAALSFNQTLADLQRLKERLRVTERIAARRDLARQVAHEIKNPLMPIRTSVETLQKLRARRSPAFEDYVDEALSTVLSEVARMTKLVENFAAYGRLPEPHPTRFDLVLLCERVAQLHAELGATIQVEASSTPLWVTADRDQITQAVTNLLKNAVEATADRQDRLVELHVSLSESTDPEQAQALVEVWDNGPGVPQQLISTLMEPYRTSKAGGTGLGLAISHRIAVEHGGDLTYESRQGALFRLSLRQMGPPQAN